MTHEELLLIHSDIEVASHYTSTALAKKHPLPANPWDPAS